MHAIRLRCKRKSDRLLRMDTIAGMKESLTIRLDDETRAWLDQLAQQEDRSVSSMVRVLLMEAKAAREGK